MNEKPADVAVDVDEPEPTYYQNIPLGGKRGTDFFYKVYMLVTIQYFLSTLSIWFASGDSLPESFKEGYKNHTIGIIAIVLLLIVWIAGYFLKFLPENCQSKTAVWWWAVYVVYVLVFAYSAGYIASNDVLDVNFLFNLYILTSFAGVWLYTLFAHMQGWYLRTGYMIIVVIVFNYLSWTLMHYAGLTDAGFTANLLTAGAAGLLVIMGIVFTAVCLESGDRYKGDEYVYASVLFLVETFVIIYVLLASLYVQPRKPFIAKTPSQIADDLKKERDEAQAKAAKKREEEEAAKKADSNAPVAAEKQN